MCDEMIYGKTYLVFWINIDRMYTGFNVMWLYVAFLTCDFVMCLCCAILWFNVSKGLMSETTIKDLHCFVRNDTICVLHFVIILKSEIPFISKCGESNLQRWCKLYVLPSVLLNASRIENNAHKHVSAYYQQCIFFYLCIINYVWLS